MNKNKKTTNSNGSRCITVMDTEQLGFHYDVIKCPSCGLVQQARITHTSPLPTMIHECESCHDIIEDSDWNSQVTI